MHLERQLVAERACPPTVDNHRRGVISPLLPGRHQAQNPGAWGDAPAAIIIHPNP